MKLFYKLDTEDFVTLHLYINENSKTIIKQRQLLKKIVCIILLVASAYFLFFKNDYALGISLIIGSLVYYLIHESSTKKARTILQKRILEKLVREMYKNKISILNEVELTSDIIYIKFAQTEIKTSSTEIENFVETKDYFYIKFKSYGHLIIPRKEIKDLDTFKNIIANYNVEYINY